ncbi:MAG: transposase [Bacteroidales bacterium]|nr:transposase [Bacteroidales bacterium]
MDYSIKELLIQRVFKIIAGYEDCNDLREDMILKMCAGRLPQSDNNLVSQPTMTRLENSVTRSDLFRLGKCPIGNN